MIAAFGSGLLPGPSIGGWYRIPHLALKRL